MGGDHRYVVEDCAGVASAKGICGHHFDQDVESDEGTV